MTGEEWFDVYDGNMRPVGAAPRSEVHARGQAEETAGIFEADARDLIALFEGRVPELTAEGRVPAGDGLRPAAERVTADRFVPRDGSYYLDVLRRLLNLSPPDRA